jgi:hypothetical protein
VFFTFSSSFINPNLEKIIIMKKQITLTNILLTIIAFCLVFNLLVNGNLISKAYAGANHQTTQVPTEVILIGTKDNNAIPVSLEHTGRFLRSVPVELTNNNALPVNIKQINSKEIQYAEPIRTKVN